MYTVLYIFIESRQMYCFLSRNYLCSIFGKVRKSSVKFVNNLTLYSSSFSIEKHKKKSNVITFLKKVVLVLSYSKHGMYIAEAFIHLPHMCILGTK
jgi:hypothetical protein